MPEHNWQLDIYFDGVHHICPIPAVDEADAKKQTSAIIDRCTDVEMLLWDNLEGKAYEDDEVIGYVQLSAPRNPKERVIDPAGWRETTQAKRTPLNHDPTSGNSDDY